MKKGKNSNKKKYFRISEISGNGNSDSPDDIFLVKELSLDPLENQPNMAVSYVVFGYIKRSNIPKKVTMISKDECWAMIKDMPKYIFEEIDEIINLK